MKLRIVKHIVLIILLDSLFLLTIYFLGTSTYAQAPQGSTTCSVNMCVNISSPSGKYFTNWLPMNYTGSSGNTTYYSYNLSYTFCPEEGNYTATFIYTPTGVTGTVSPIYTVNYDANPNWCYCYGNYYNKTVAWGLPGVDQYCCGYDPNTYVVSCSPSGQQPCSSSSNNTACCSASTNCVYNGSCYSSGSAVTVNGITYTCSSGTWSNCVPPSSGDWIVGTSCTITSNVTVNGNLILTSGGVLTVNAATVTVTGIVIFSGGSLVLINGGNVVRG